MNKKYKFAIIAGIVVLALILGGGITYKLAGRNEQKKQEIKAAENNTTKGADASDNADSADNDLDAKQLFDSSEDGSENVNQNSTKKKSSGKTAKKASDANAKSSNTNSVSGNTNSNGSTAGNKNNSSENKGDKKDDNSELNPDNPSDDKNQDNDKNQVDLTEGGKWTKYY